MHYDALRQKLFAPVDAASIVVFRIGFGLIMLVEVLRYFILGWISEYYLDPAFHFKYYGFEWVRPWPDDGMYYHFAVMGVCALLITIGATYRLAVILFALAFAYVFLLDQAYYLNHFYLVILFSVLLCVIPAHRCCSVDARLRPRWRSSTLPAWTVWLLRAQMEVMLIYAGLVKINPDWLQLEPLRMWLSERHNFPQFLGYLFTQDWAIAMAAYGIIILHVVGAPLLLWKRARLAVFCTYAAFHTLNHFVFNIGIFPWFTLFGSLLFFDPAWPKQVWLRLRRSVAGIPAAPELTPGMAKGYKTAAWQQPVILAFVMLWTLSQIVIPLRHFLYPGNVGWTEEGHRFAWRMKLRDKEGRVEFLVVDADDRRRMWRVKPEEFLTRRQASKIAGIPDMLLQFAHFLKHHWQTHYGVKNPEVTASAWVSLNGRRPALLLDPNRDLAKVQRDLRPGDWILPLREPLKTADNRR
jgi:vitamin K-dependent gamma-carboxylase